MSTVLRRNRKASDRDIVRLNNLGLSLAAIGKRLNCHPTSITLRLKSLKIDSTDTRHSFMEDILNNLPTAHQDILADLLETNNDISIKTYISDLIAADLKSREVPPKIEEVIELDAVA